MGIHYFYTWLTYRYPLIRKEFSPRSVPRVDYLYLDLNGIIHRCAKDDSALFKDLLCGKRTEEIYIAILNYTNYVISLVKPRKGIVIAVDGVAPRAKMNNQRNRRFMASKTQSSVNDFMINTLKISPNIVYFKNNSISPGTEFMIQLNRTMYFFIQRKLHEDLDWRDLEVVFSGGDVPGEGEHKILNIIRQNRQKPGFNNLDTHCIYGNDSDLVLLSLITHLPYVMLLREEFQPAKRVVINSATKRTSEPTRMEVIYINVLREYFQKEFEAVVADSPATLENIIDDFVLFSFFIGNDFLHQVYCMNTKMGIFDEFIEIMLRFYKKTKRFLTQKSVIDWEVFYLVLQEFLPLQKKMIKTTIADFNSRLAELHKNSFYAQFRKRKGEEEAEPREESSAFAHNRYDVLDKREGDKPDKGKRKEKKDAKSKTDSSPEKTGDQSTDVVGKLMTDLNLKPTDGVVESEKSGVPSDSSPTKVSKAANSKEESSRGESPSPGSDAEVVEDPPLEPLYQRTTTIKELNEEELTEPEEEGVFEIEEVQEDVIEEESKKYLAEFRSQYQKLVGARDLMQNIYNLLNSDQNYQEVYYREYFGIQEDFSGHIARICNNYLNGVDFVYKYYYCGCPSWNWYYQYHLSPLLFDLHDYLRRMFGNGQQIKFTYEPSQPTEPYIQLLYILPHASLNLLPETLVRKVLEPGSAIAQYYPKDYDIAPFDKHKDYTWLAMIEYIDDAKMDQFFRSFDYKSLTEEELFRNRRGDNFLMTWNKDRSVEVVSPVTGFEKVNAKIKISTIEIDSEFASLPNFIDYTANSRIPTDSLVFPSLRFTPHIVFQRNCRNGRYKFELVLDTPALEDMLRTFDQEDRQQSFFNGKSQRIVHYDPVFHAPLVVTGGYWEKTDTKNEGFQRIIDDTIEYLHQHGIVVSRRAIDEVIRAHKEIPILTVATPSFSTIEFQGLKLQKGAIRTETESPCTVAYFSVFVGRSYPKLKEFAAGPMKNWLQPGDICFNALTGDLIRLSDVDSSKEVPAVRDYEVLTFNPSTRRVTTKFPEARLHLIDERLVQDLGLRVDELRVLWLVIDSIRIYCDHASHTTMVLGDAFEVGLNFINFLNRRPEDWKVVTDMVRVEYKYRQDSRKPAPRKNSIGQNECMFIWDGEGGRVIKAYNVYLTDKGLQAVREYFVQNKVIVDYLLSQTKHLVFFDKKARVLRYKTQFNAAHIFRVPKNSEAAAEDINITLFKIYAEVMKRDYSNLMLLPSLHFSFPMDVVNDSIAQMRLPASKTNPADKSDQKQLNPIYLMKYAPNLEVVWPPFGVKPYYHEEGDRVAFVNSQHAFIKFGSLATVIGVYKDVVEVLFDEAFIGATNLNGRCPNFRGKVVCFFDIFNMTKWNNIVVDFNEDPKTKKKIWKGEFDLEGLLSMISDKQRSKWKNR